MAPPVGLEGISFREGFYCCGALRKLRLSKQARFPQTAATRSGRSSRPRRRSHRSLPPSLAQSAKRQNGNRRSLMQSIKEEQKKTTLLGGVRILNVLNNFNAFHF